MANPHYIALAVAMTLAPAPFSYGDLTVEVARAVVAEGTTSLTVPVAVTGSENVTDMNAIVQIAGGGPLTGTPAAPQVTAVDYGASVWSAAPGGFVSFFASASPSSAIIDPSLSLIQAGESVTASGTLMTLSVNTSSFPIGEYPITLTDTAAGDSELFNSGTTIPTTYRGGSISILRALDHWRLVHFAGEVENPLLESSLWGNDADPDLDGLINLIEFAIGTDPNAPGHGSASASNPGLPSSTVIASGASQSVEISYSRRKTATGLSLVLSSSEDQLLWQTPAPGLTQIGASVPIGDATYEFVKVRIPVPNGTTRLFSRFSASHSP